MEQAGGSLRYLPGRPVDYVALSDGQLIPEPIVAGHPDIVAEVREAVRETEGQL